MLKTEELSLQEMYAPASICYGCGPANEAGLHIRSYNDGDTIVAQWQPEPKYQAFAGVLYGGLIGCLLDCHCNWAAAWHLMQKARAERPPCTVTAEFTLKFLRPAPADKAVKLVARVVNSDERRATVEGELQSGGISCALLSGTFVAVKPGHPAYHRW